jgi:hypothetical protein
MKLPTRRILVAAVAVLAIGGSAVSYYFYHIHWTCCAPPMPLPPL